jgi:hypothetical protein
MIKCPDYETCEAKVDSRHNKVYCLDLPSSRNKDDEMGYFRCYYYGQAHPKSVKKPRQYKIPNVTVK